MLLILSLLIWAGVARWTEQGGSLPAARSFAAALLAGLFAMRFFDSLAAGLETALPFGAAEMDAIALLFLFWGGYAGLGWLAEQAVPECDTDSRLARVSRYLFAGLTAYVVLALQLTALQASPFAQARLGYRPGARYFFGISAPEMQWLYFADLVDRRALATQSAPAPANPAQAAGDPAAAASEPGSTRGANRKPVGASSLIRGARLTTQRLTGKSPAAASMPSAQRASPAVVDVVFADEPPAAQPPSGGNRAAAAETSAPSPVEEAASTDAAAPPTPSVPAAQLTTAQQKQLVEALRKLKSGQKSLTAERPDSGKPTAEQDLDELEQLLHTLQSAGPDGGEGSMSFEELLEEIQKLPTTDAPADDSKSSTESKSSAERPR